MQRLVISLNFISHCPKWESHRTDQTVDLRCCRGQERIYLSFVRLTQESTVASQLFFTVDQPFNCFGDIIISRKNRRVQKTKQKSNRFRAFPSFEHKTMAFGCCLRAKTSIEIIDLDFVSFSVFFLFLFLSVSSVASSKFHFKRRLNENRWDTKVHVSMFFFFSFDYFESDTHDRFVRIDFDNLRLLNFNCFNHDRQNDLARVRVERICCTFCQCFSFSCFVCQHEVSACRRVAKLNRFKIEKIQREREIGVRREVVF